MADSGTYTPETVARRYKIAEQLLGEPKRPVVHWAQGLDELAKGYFGGKILKDAETAETTGRKAAIAQALSALGGGASPEPAAAPTAAPADPSLPRGLRNNNPLNIEAGTFTQGQPGFAGSDGRFAKFDTAQNGTNAASALLDSYARRGLTTPAGIIGRWAPSTDGNNTTAYAANVAKALGIGPNDVIPPEMRSQLIAAMGQQENGRPVAPSPANAPPVTPQAPQAAPPAVGGNKAALAALLNPWTPPAVAGALAGQISPSYGFQTLPDGTILRTNPKTGGVEPAYKAESKPTFGVIGEDQFGNKIHGWIDPYKKTTEPVGGAPSPNSPATTASIGGAPSPAAPASLPPNTITGPDGKPIEIPPGQDPKKFREHVTTATADAKSGKLTEVQANSTQFANRMENAEQTIGDVGNQGTSLSGKLSEHIPIVGNYAQSKDYQRYAQAKSQFITALLRKESGAAISQTEFERYEKEFFPQPGDNEAVIAQKGNARKVAIEAMKKGAGPIYQSPKPAAPTAPERKAIGGKNYVKQNGQWFEE